MSKIKIAMLAAAAAIVCVACSESETAAPESDDSASVSSPAPVAEPEPAPAAAAAGPADGELALPADYTSWTSFLSGIEKAETKQIRDIYINSTAAGVEAGQPLPDGSVLVMEIYAAVESPEGLGKGDLSKIFVMEKQAGWGTGAAAPTGSWVYSAFEADGTRVANADYSTCRGCHLPFPNLDFVPRLDEYLAAR